MIISRRTYPFKFDAEKAVEVILYIAQRLPKSSQTFYYVLKMLYFADKAHLQKYGRFICGDHYIAMKSGPVPSGSYDLVNEVRGKSWLLFADHVRNAFDVRPDNTVVPLRDPDLDLLSKSDMEYLDKSIAENGHLTFTQLRDKSHDQAYEAADANDTIPFEEILAMLPNGKAVLEHIHRY
jgi:uncharacterized phage-associated protein